MTEKHKGIKQFRNMKYPSSRDCYLRLYFFLFIAPNLDFAKQELAMEHEIE